MRPLFQLLLFLLARSTPDQLQKQVELLKAENEMLRRRVPKQRILLKAGERALLLKLGKELGPGIRRVFAMAFVHIASRRVFVTEGTFWPDATWITSQADAFLAYANREHLGCTILMRDLDGKFSADFDARFTKQGVRVKPVGRRAPNLNAFVERWIQSLKHEALDHFVVFGRKHFDHIVREYVTYYLKHRPHQGIGNQLIGTESRTASTESVTVDSIQCQSRLGSLLKHYHRAA